VRIARGFAALLASAVLASTANSQTAPQNGVRVHRLVIRNAMVVSGNGTPAAGPYDIVVEGNRITQMLALDPVSLGSKKRPTGDAEIDATGKYVLPGLINAHGHLQDERGGIPQPVQYELNLWLACGITTVREVGGSSDVRKVLAMRERSRLGQVAAPRILEYPFVTEAPAPQTADETRQRVRDLKALGVDGIKLHDVDRVVMEAAEDEAHKLNLRVAHHVGVQDVTAWDDIRLGTTSIEHWYGIPTPRSMTAFSTFHPPTTIGMRWTASATPAGSGGRPTPRP
jgi:Dihydroorotase and related cyclic amidohydrolases